MSSTLVTGWDDDPAPVLDIGAGVGAILVHLATPPERDELWACPLGQPERPFHTGVHRRKNGWIALFVDVPAGDYELLTDIPVWIRVKSGEVFEVDFRLGSTEQAP